MIYMAISRKSDFPVRMAALGALAVMIITVIICLVRIFNNAAAGSKVPAYPDMPPVEVTPPNSMVLVASIVFLLVVFAVVVLLSFREHRRAAEDAAKPKSPGFSISAKEKFSLDSLD